MEACFQQAVMSSYIGGRSASGACDGEGAATFANGVEYQGGWQEGHMHGTGRLTFPDSASWAGGMEGSTICGTGVYQWGASASYEGGMQGGQRHGWGRQTFGDSSAVYEGEWREGLRHGQGTLCFDAARACFYEGSWQGDMKHGQGTMRYPSGSTYFGDWHQDAKQGTGTMHWAARGESYEGQWLANLPHGRGRHVWHSAQARHAASHASTVMCNRYEGEFQAGRRHGQGTLYYATGARYEGHWVDDKKHGEGMYVSEDGHGWAGRFVADRPQPRTEEEAGSGAQAPAASAAAAATGSACSSPVHVTRPSSSPAPGTRPFSSPPPTARPSSGTSAAAAKAPATALPAESAPASRPSSGAATAAAKAQATAPPAALAAAAPPQQAAGPPMGAQAAHMALSIDDLFAEEPCPAAARKQLFKLLAAYNSELRVVYEKYSKCPSPYLSGAGPTTVRTSWALTAAQFWELAREAGLLSRHTPLSVIDTLLQQACSQPEAVIQWRRKVLNSAEAAGAAPSTGAPAGGDATAASPAAFLPARELLFREFAEAVVRLAARRYPQLPSLERRLHQVLTQHLLPLLGVPSSRKLSTQVTALGNSRLSAVAAAAAGGLTVPGSPTAAAAANAAASSDPLADMTAELVASYLRSKLPQLAQLFCSMAEGRGVSGQNGASPELAEVMTRSVAPRQVTSAMAAGGLIREPLSAAAVACALLESCLHSKDPEGQRLRLDGSGSLEDLEPPLLPDEAAISTAAAEAEAQRMRHLLLWADAPLLLPEFVWGLARCAVLAAAGQQGQPGGDALAGLLGKLQAFFEGKWQLLARLSSHFEAAGALPEADANATQPASLNHKGVDSGADSGSCAHTTSLG